MKKFALLSLMIAAMMIPAAHAAFTLTELPDGYVADWAGKSSYYVNLGGGQILHGHIEFAVYDTQAGDVGIVAPGGHQYVYAYQVFNTGTYATAALNYFGLKGINPDAIASMNDIDTAQNPGNGIDATQSYFNASKTKAVFEFDGGVLVVGENSFFLLIGSDFAPIVGGYEMVANPNDDIIVPGDDTGNGNNIPEPATMALLLGGTLLSLRKRK
jgi:hypothetical protein